MQQGVADSSKTLLAWAPIPLRKLEPCIPSQSSQQNQRLPWFLKVDLPPPLDRSVPALVSSASQLRSVGQSALLIGAGEGCYDTESSLYDRTIWASLSFWF